MEDFIDIHHEVWPRRQYRSKLEQAYRNLPCNKVRMLRSLHNELHATTEPPAKPSRHEMSLAIAAHYEGACKCGGGP